VEDIACTDTWLGLFVANVHESTFSRLNLNCVNDAVPERPHCLYMEQGCRDLVFNDVTLTKGTGYCLQIYFYNTGDGSDNVVFNNLTLDATGGHYPMTIGGNSMTNFVFNGITITDKAGTDEAAIQVSDMVDGLEFHNISAVGTWLIGGATGSDILLKDGTFDGTAIAKGAALTGLIVTNVTLT
jgi:hypothetical protein